MHPRRALYEETATSMPPVDRDQYGRPTDPDPESAPAEYPGAPSLQQRYDGKQLRTKTGFRKMADHQPLLAYHVQMRAFQRDHRDRRAVQPDPLHNVHLLPPSAFPDKPISSVGTRLVRAATNRFKSPIFCLRWTPLEGRWLITGSNSGDFTLWDGKTFCFTKVQASHNSAVRAMEWRMDGQWMISGDREGFVKYWQSNMHNVMMKKLHQEPVRGLSFCPDGSKFASCSDDNTLRRWDFLTGEEEVIFRGHGAEVRCIDWNPCLKVIASGSKDSRMPVKLWDAGSGQCLDTLYAHKHPVTDLQWNGRDENLLLTASRDGVLVLFDMRDRSKPLTTFRGHRKEVTAVAWHPLHRSLFASGGSDGSICYWLAENDRPAGRIEGAHDSSVWSLDWHPVGHVLASGSNDYSTKFWTRNRPGDRMRDRFNLNGLSSPDDYDDSQEGFLCATRPEAESDFEEERRATLIPGLDLPSVDMFRGYSAKEEAKEEREEEEEEFERWWH